MSEPSGKFTTLFNYLLSSCNHTHTNLHTTVLRCDNQFGCKMHFCQQANEKKKKKRTCVKKNKIKTGKDLKTGRTSKTELTASVKIHFRLKV